MLLHISLTANILPCNCHFLHMLFHYYPIMASFSRAQSNQYQRALIRDETEDSEADEDVPAADNVYFSDAEEPIASGQGPCVSKWFFGREQCW